MRVSGSSTLAEGKINENLVATGSTRINGNLECEEFKSSGSLKGSGNLIVNGYFRSSGTFRLTGSLTAEGDAKSTGSTTIDGEISVKGKYTKSGTLRAGKQVEALEGVEISGLTKIQGNLMSKKDVVLRGNTTVDGNIKAENVFVGLPIDRRPFIKHPYKVHGNIVADNEVHIKKTFVAGDVKGRDVKLGHGTEVAGAVYYINSIEVSSRVNLAKKPVQIEDE
ncbi:MAG: polymer-forming cytoskeletal protein [Candidatus Heimdallarchaeota archaeon]|nr:polymer-forming cytoskeletal protein [Candidatus Heimdallarchaeota archaeon]MBY8994218.1 polymer-forming cytoskeletal protein [Candidatus Heimdallarchaeota archaeon]